MHSRPGLPSTWCFSVCLSIANATYHTDNLWLWDMCFIYAAQPFSYPSSPSFQTSLLPSKIHSAFQIDTCHRFLPTVSSNRGLLPLCCCVVMILFYHRLPSFLYLFISLLGTHPKPTRSPNLAYLLRSTPPPEHHQVWDFSPPPSLFRCRFSIRLLGNTFISPRGLKSISIWGHHLQRIPICPKPRHSGSKVIISSVVSHSSRYGGTRSCNRAGSWSNHLPSWRSLDVIMPTNCLAKCLTEKIYLAEELQNQMKEDYGTKSKVQKRRSHAYPIFAQKGYENPREATGRIVCANCHVANKPVDIEVPQTGL
ncbi:unnamed protein product [Lactuca saligna]|uniref:Cytochrome f large domain-containing protein n=1 Tax=Lactuca saligna TaxID=75948 RepID=A0AA35ZU19_LACSI|nr:unnamed protein product [Lactuca saligna]